MSNSDIVPWLLGGDVSLQYQTHRDLLETDRPSLKKRIATEGWGSQYLSFRNSDGHWGRGFYQPKWTCSHYTLLELRNLNVPPHNTKIGATLESIFQNQKSPDGGILPIGTPKKSDVCINGMVLNYASYFQVNESYLESVVDFLLAERMLDGGFNCHSNRKGAVHSSLHTTLSVLEGIHEYDRNGYRYRLGELKETQRSAEEFVLMHRLFLSDRTGEIINPNFLKFCYPNRWYYNILKAMDYFRSADAKYDARMDDAIEVIIKKRIDGRWKLASKHPGQIYFEMEKSGHPSRWITLKALRVLKHFGIK